MNVKFIPALVFCSLLGSGFLRAESTPAQALLVLANRDNTLAIVDPSSLRVVARVPVGPDPHEVIASADGRFAYVSNYGGGAYNTLADLIGWSIRCGAPGRRFGAEAALRFNHRSSLRRYRIPVCLHRSRAGQTQKSETYQMTVFVSRQAPDQNHFVVARPLLYANGITYEE